MVRAMVECSAQFGFHELSVEALTDRAGVSRATFYERFADKEECFMVALEELGAALMEEVQGASSAAEPDGATQACLGALVEFAVADVPGAQALFGESLGVCERSRVYRDELCDLVAASLKDVWGYGRSGMGAELLVGGVFRLLAMRLRHGASGVHEQLVRELAIWAGSYEADGGSDEPLPALTNDAVTGPASVSAEATFEPVVLPHGRHSLSDAQIARSQRERILAAVVELSYEHGYSTVGVSQITTAARVGRNAFYGLFRDKQQVALEANELFFHELMRALAVAFFSVEGTDWPERIWRAGVALGEVLQAEPQRAHLSVVDLHAIGPPAVQHAYSRLAAFTLFVEEAYNYRPQARELPRVTSDALSALVFEVMYRQLHATRDPRALQRRIPEFVYACVAPFVGPSEARRFVVARARREI
jgi:AcrR family transcriptional regulator